MGSDILEIPIVATEQYPKALGKLVPEIEASNVLTFEKKKFSMVVPEMEEYLKRLENDIINRKQVVLFGIEAHVCVYQTAMDLSKKRIHDEKFTSVKIHERKNSRA